MHAYRPVASSSWLAVVDAVFVLSHSIEDVERDYELDELFFYIVSVLLLLE